jgi:hypothetical protein
MILCFPNPVTSRVSHQILSLVLRYNLTLWVIVPFLFRVPSTWNSQCCLSFKFWVKFRSMNFPLAPESIRAFVLTILLDFSGLIKNETGTEIDLFLIIPISTE